MRRRAARSGLLLVGLLVIVGRFLPPTASWGFHHYAYLPLGVWIAAALAWVLLLLPAARRGLGFFFYGPLAGWIFGRSLLRPLLVCLLLTVLFVFLRTPTHLLGDGVLIGELVARGAPFRAHDAMDFLVKTQLIQMMGKVGDATASFDLYAISSWIAGFLAVLLALVLLRRSRFPEPTKMFIFLLWLFAAPTLLYCGYVESYGFLSVALLGFLWSGALAQRGEAPPWLPGLLYGIAFFFHTTALFAAPALLWLAFRKGPKGVSRAGWAFRVLGPAALGPFLAVIFHLAAGFDQSWFEREFLESKNQRTVLIALTGEHGLFSIIHWKDLLNWLVLVVPVTGWLVLSGAAPLRRRLREPDVAFLLVQVVCFLAPFLLLDRKLGAARDWDLLTPQVAGFAYLAGRFFLDETQEPEGTGFLPGIRVAGPWVALLFVIPWLWVNASTDRALQRFDDIRRDFPRFPRAYAAEELGKYYRDHGDVEKSLGYYEECVETFPSNARTRILLGTNYLYLERTDEAIEQYDKALEIDPGNWMALDMKAKLALQRKDFVGALPLFRELAPKRPQDPDIWGGYGYAAYQSGKFQEAYDAFVHGCRLRDDPELFYFTGLAAGHLDRWDDSVLWLSRALQRAGNDTQVLYALAVAYWSRHEQRVRNGDLPKEDDLQNAKRLLEEAIRMAPNEPEMQRFRELLDRLLGGQGEPPASP